MNNQNYFTGKFSRYRHKIIWVLNDDCDYGCEYCNKTVTEEKQQGIDFSTENIVSRFDAAGFEWLIILAGGEPFLYPGFIELVKQLSAKNKFVFSTNLCGDKIYEFAEVIDPEKIVLINASFHPEYRQKTSEGIKPFIDKVLMLQNRGFEVLVSHVAYPPFIPQIPGHFELLKQQGVKITSCLTFRSEYKGKYFPEAYTKQEIEVIKKYSVDRAEHDIALGKTNFYGRYCDAGYTFYFMDINGNVRRCGSIEKHYGNLFLGTFIPGRKARPCIAIQCIDCYLGFVSVKEKRAGKIAIYREKIKSRRTE